MDKKESFQKALHRLTRLYVERFPSRLEEVEQLVELAFSEPSNDVVFELYRFFHSLRGSAATYGFSELSQMARTIEHVFKNFHQCGQLPTEESLVLLKHFLGEWKKEVQNKQTVELSELYSAWQTKWMTILGKDD